MKRTNIRDILKWIAFLYFLTLIVLVYRVHEDKFGISEFVDKVKLGFLANDSVKVKNDTEMTNQVRTQSLEVRTQTARQLPPTKTQSPLVYRRYGPGENGTAVDIKGLNFSLPGLAERNKLHSFNTFVSDMVSLHRKVPDMRPSACKRIEYPDNLPPISVVIIFRDEWWSILLRTVYSVLETSPDKLIHEVILVDDGSTNSDLITRVKIHVSNVPKLRLVQNEKPLGLMMARQTGINAVTSDLFAVLDGHMEVGPGWLEPLIHRLVENPNALLCSHVGSINQETFYYGIDDNKPENLKFDNYFPFFDHMNLDQMFAEYSPEYKAKRNHSVEPIPAGTIQGMMMVMRKEFFQELGGFDPGMRVWGSEQMEVSVKVWLCGGVIEMVPCSKVAHMYRITPWGKVDPKNDFHSLNKARMVNVWMDPPYSDLINDYLSDKNYTAGDLRARHEIRIRNKCKPYQHFVDVVRSISDVYIPLNVRHKGQISNSAAARCIDLAKKDGKVSIILYPCHKMITSNQYFILTEKGHIRGTEGHLFDIEKSLIDVKLVLRRSSAEWRGRDAEWKYNGETIENLRSGYCITILDFKGIGLKECNGSAEQKWQWGISHI